MSSVVPVNDTNEVFDEDTGQTITYQGTSPDALLNSNSSLKRIEGKSLGTLATYSSNNEGSLASTLEPKKRGEWIDVVKAYPWTLSNTLNKDDIPFVELHEYRCNESQIKRQLSFYAKLTQDTYEGALGYSSSKKAVMSVYTEIFPQDDPSGFIYRLPYFNKTGFELNTPNWQQLDPIGESLKGMAGGAGNILTALGAKQAAARLGVLTKGAEFIQAAAETSLMYQYPSVGVQDRPRVFAGHSERQITISFPLFNTVNENDWIKNRDLVYLLMSQNLYNKRDYITGVPPVFYDVHIPGQYYCYAAAMTNINVENLGNTRVFYDSYIIPDAYQVTLTLTEMVTPSKNQFEAMTTGNPRSVVAASEKPTSAKVEQAFERVSQLGQELIQRAQAGSGGPNTP